MRPEILRQLCPQRPPSGFGEPTIEYTVEDQPGFWLSQWSKYLRERIAEALPREALERTGWVATGVYRVTSIDEGRWSKTFPVVAGYRFGALLLRAERFGDLKDFFIPLEEDVGLPLLERSATFSSQSSSSPAGYAAAVFDVDGETLGITAGHVTARKCRGDRVDVVCSACGEDARLVSRAPGLIDAAKIMFPCGGPPADHTGNLRHAREGDAVGMHLGASGYKRATVMMSLSTPTEILTAAAPKHFLTSARGTFGDSGSLIASECTRLEDAELIGMYLGEADCEDREGVIDCYGYALDLDQAAKVLRADDLRGEFNG